jgi:hypothetical protein
MRVRTPFGVALGVMAVAAVTGCSAVFPLTSQLTLRMRPARPMTTTSCVSEARRYGWSAEGGATICAIGRGRSWYHADLKNTGQGAYPLCKATAIGPHGNVVFNGRIIFLLGGFPAGLFASGHRSMAFYWYLPQKTRGAIVRYMATCSVNSNPPI